MLTESSRPPATRERFLLASVVFTVLFAQLLLYPGIDTLVTALGGADIIQASTLFLAVELGAAIVFVWVWGRYSDLRGTRVRFLQLAALAGAAGYGALAGGPQLLELPFFAALVLRAIQGASTIGVLSLAMTMLMDLPGGHGRNMGAAGIAIGAGTALGAPVGGLLYAGGPFLPLSVAALLLGGIALLGEWVVDRTPTARRHQSVLMGIGRLRAMPGMAVPFAFGFIDRLSAGVFALAGTLYFRTGFDLSPAATGGMLFLFFAPFALFQYPLGALSDRIGRTIPIVVGSIGYGLGVVAVGLAPSVEIVGIAMVAVGVIGAFMSPATMALVTDLAPETDRGIAMAGFNATGTIGFLTGVVLAGVVAGASGFARVFLIAGSIEIGLAILAAPAVIRLGRARN